MSSKILPMREYEERIVTPDHVRMRYRAEVPERFDVPLALATAFIAFFWCAAVAQMARGDAGLGPTLLLGIFLLVVGYRPASSALHHGETYTYLGFVECTPTVLCWRLGAGWGPEPDETEHSVEIAAIARVEGTCGSIDGAAVRSFYLVLRDDSRLECPELEQSEVFDMLRRHFAGPMTYDNEPVPPLPPDASSA